MTVQPDPHGKALLAQVRALDSAIRDLEARLTNAGAEPSPDAVAASLADPARALSVAAREALREEP